MARNTYGLDLGSYEIKVYDKKNDSIWKEKDVLAIKNQRDIIAVGDDAYAMFERSPSNIEVIFPMQGGVISKFNNMQFLLQDLLKKGRQFARGSEYVIAVPTDVTEVEKKAFFDLVIHSTARAKEVERAVADAIGLNQDVENTKGIFIANFGGETIELSVIASGGIVFNRLLKIGGVNFDREIMNQVRYSHDFLIGQHTAEVLRKRFGVYTGEADAMLSVAGRDLITGLPMRKNISQNLVRAALKEPLLECVHTIYAMLDRTPPEIRKSIEKNGIYMTGGVANMPGLQTYIAKATGLKTFIAEQPDICAVYGLKRIMMSKELSKLAYSMLDDNYRWMK